MTEMAQGTQEDSKRDAFPFRDLPGLVQTQILRQYVPFSDKVTVLGNMAEFSGLLDRDSPCWVHGYDALFDLLPALSSLTPGFYIRSGEAFWKHHHGYYVSMDRENHVTFTLCMVLNPTWEYMMGVWEKSLRHCRRSRTTRVNSTKDVKNFIRLFLNTYTLARHSHVNVYVKDEHVFVVDRQHRKIVWDDCTVHDLHRSGNCCLVSGTFKKTHVAYLHVNLSDDTVVYVCGNERDVLRSVPFESVVLSEKTHKVKESRNVCQISFEILEDNTILMCIDKHMKNVFDYYFEDVWNTEWMRFFGSRPQDRIKRFKRLRFFR